MTDKDAIKYYKTLDTIVEVGERKIFAFPGIDPTVSHIEGNILRTIGLTFVNNDGELIFLSTIYLGDNDFLLYLDKGTASKTDIYAVGIITSNQPKCKYESFAGKRYISIPFTGINENPSS